ncbi:predicted protein [Chaetomium globosum CBS 148.51]|uniref:Uncharacterized protein n=1 Tax=Chaetomium globosum (strain ATCC 6205 / CBS 148.51 / DSM 1962 / NBRC 6347 / NRRL 1970) TaxID=306901 RepID=Q2H8K7_CHAGB|nr:uncharacterized protein CHGG_03447 [Chaetomium globosum CBS 148.51]EAQ91512.1 predicted protein [Chaetomium globosum CBS 148.51]
MASEPRSLAREVVASLRNLGDSAARRTHLGQRLPSGLPSAKVPMTLHDDPGGSNRMTGDHAALLSCRKKRRNGYIPLPGDRYVVPGQGLTAERGGGKHSSINHMRAADGCAPRFVLPIAAKNRDQSTSQMTLSPSPPETQPRHIRQNLPRRWLPE